MTNKRNSWSWLGSVGVLLLAGSVVSATQGCSKKKEEDPKAKAEKTETDKKRQQGDRYTDGKRLEGALKDWSKRWADTADLPACDPLLKDAADQELCKTAAAALTTLKAAVAKPEPPPVLMHAAAELALASENASEKLRAASMEKLQAEHKTTPARSGAPLTTRIPSGALSGLPRVRPLASGMTSKGAASKLADKVKGAKAPPPDPAMQVMQAYSRVNRASLRYLSQYLQFGPLPTRKACFGELEALSKRKEAWPALGRTLREAAMAENDPGLQGQLKALAPKLSRRPKPPGAPGTPDVPPGHPPVTPPAAPPAAPAKP